MNVLALPLAALMTAAFSPPPPLTPAPQGSGCNVVEVWVDPVHGTDPGPLSAPVPNQSHEWKFINNVGLPFKTIQSAIDYVGSYLRDTYHPTQNPDREAIVHLLPGIYGPATIYNDGVGNGEQFPIHMHDRVHLRGVNARRCVIRGVHALDGAYGSNTIDYVFWPFDGPCNAVGASLKQVLIDCTYSSLVAIVPYAAVPVILPWADDSGHNRTPEFIEGVTFQGGDVQVYCGTSRELPLPVYTRISNCLFDMRDGITVEEDTFLSGPSIGLLVAQTWVDEIDPLGGLIVQDHGYLPQEVHSVGNTFLMAEFDQTQGGGVWLRARPGAVGLLDTCDPVCTPSFPTDPIPLPRGVNRIGVQNTLFRTHTGLSQSQAAEMAMVGVGGDDALVNDGTQFRDTNAYALARAGSASLAPGNPQQSFVSPPYFTGTTSSGSVSYPFTPSDGWPLFAASQASVPPQSAARKIWDGDLAAAPPQVDPAFVGEYLRTVTPALPTYRDWRLLPGSPLQNQGWLGETNEFLSAAIFYEPACDALKVQTWDHEQFGNRRVVDGAPDIGFDEVQLGVMAGSYANHSLSHNRSGVLNPFASNEQATRFLFLREKAPDTGQLLQARTVSLRSHETVAGTQFRAWTNPPGSLMNPTQFSTLPAGYDYMYTETNNPVAWMQSFSTSVPPSVPWPNWQMAPGQPVVPMTRIQFPADDEGASFASWANVQAVVSMPGFPSVKALLGSMQPEFR